jgi:hypothetical protein
VNDQRITWLVVFALGPVISGCGPSKEEQAIDAFNRGVDGDEKGDLDDAIAEYSEAIGLNPKLAEAYCNRGNAYGQKGIPLFGLRPTCSPASW